MKLLYWITLEIMMYLIILFGGLQLGTHPMIIGFVAAGVIFGMARLCVWDMRRK